MQRIEPGISRFRVWCYAASRNDGVGITTALAMTALAPSLVLPLRLAFLDEGADAFLGVARHHVLGHYLCRIAIGIGKAHFGLAVERRLAELYRIGGFERDLLRQRDRRFAFGAGGNDTIDEAELAC